MARYTPPYDPRPVNAHGWPVDDHIDTQAMKDWRSATAYTDEVAAAFAALNPALANLRTQFPRVFKVTFFIAYYNPKIKAHLAKPSADPWTVKLDRTTAISFSGGEIKSLVIRRDGSAERIMEDYGGYSMDHEGAQVLEYIAQREKFWLCDQFYMFKNQYGEKLDSQTRIAKARTKDSLKFLYMGPLISACTSGALASPVLALVLICMGLDHMHDKHVQSLPRLSDKAYEISTDKYGMRHVRAIRDFRCATANGYSTFKVPKKSNPNISYTVTLTPGVKYGVKCAQTGALRPGQ